MSSAIANVESRIQEITRDRLGSLPPSTRRAFAGHTRVSAPQKIIISKSYMLVAVYSQIKAHQLQNRVKRFGEAFPGLITTQEDRYRIAIRVNKSQRLFISNNRITDFDFCFLLGEDSTIILEKLKYRPTSISRDISVPLAYVVSFGAEITPWNCAEYFEDLLVYHIHHFRSLRSSQEKELRDGRRRLQTAE